LWRPGTLPGNAEEETMFILLIRRNVKAWRHVLHLIAITLFSLMFYLCAQGINVPELQFGPNLALFAAGLLCLVPAIITLMTREVNDPTYALFAALMSAAVLFGLLSDSWRTYSLMIGAGVGLVGFIVTLASWRHV
jgi:hypothetical protein